MTRYPAGKFEVFIDGAPDASKDIVLHELRSGCCGTPDVAVFERLPVGRSAAKFKGEFPTETNVKFQVKLGEKWVHYGLISSGEININENAEVFPLVSRSDQHLFGDATYSARIVTGILLPAYADVPGAKMRFNPIFDDVVVPNKFEVPDRGVGAGANDVILTILEPGLAIEGHGDLWTLRDVIKYICEYLNEDETHFKNPRDASVAVLDDDLSLVRNLEIPLGRHLPEILNDLLVPLGYGWFIEHVDRDTRRIEIYSRGESDLLDVVAEEQIEIKLSTDLVSNNVTDVVVVGGTAFTETTIELTPDWDASLQNEPLTKYRLGNPDWETTPGLRSVYRRWAVSNITRERLGDPYDSRGRFDPVELNTIVGQEEPFFTRRKFLPCVSKNSDGRPFGRFDGCFVEWTNESSSNATWHPVEGSDAGNELKNGRSIEILDNELAIYFNGKFPPMKQQTEGIFRLRITATIESTSRKVVRKIDSGSLLLHKKEVVINMESGFPFRKTFNSALTGRPDVDASGIVDSQASMEAFAASVLKRQANAGSDGHIVFYGTRGAQRDWLGKRVQSVSGNPLTLFEGSTFPIVDSWRVEVSNQVTTVTLSDPNQR